MTTRAETEDGGTLATNAGTHSTPAATGGPAAAGVDDRATMAAATAAATAGAATTTSSRLIDSYSPTITRHVVDDSPLIVVLLDHDRRVVECSRSFADLLRSGEPPVGRPLDELATGLPAELPTEAAGRARTAGRDASPAHGPALWTARLTLTTPRSADRSIACRVFEVDSGLLLVGQLIDEARDRAVATLGEMNSELADLSRELTKKTIALDRVHRLEESLRLALDQLLALTPAFHTEDDHAEIAHAACEGACSLFDCDVALLFEVRDDRLLPVGGHPPEAPDGAEGFSLRDDPALAEQLSTHLPRFVARPRHDDAVHCADLREQLGLSAALRVPIGIAKPAERLLVIGWQTDHEEPGTPLLALVQRFGDQVDLALTQARRREAQAEAESLHRRLERSLLPNSPVAHPSLDISLHYSPNESRLEVGGDFIDILDRGPDGVAVIVGDVTGHGPDAAALGATLRSGWEALNMAGLSLQDTAAALHQMVEREKPSDETFATALLVSIDVEHDCIDVLDLGHPPPLLCPSGNAEAIVAPTRPPLGVPAGRPLPPTRFALPEGWRLLFYTDGLVEGRAAPGVSERFGHERLSAAVADLPADAGEAELAELIAKVEARGGESFQDDVTVMLLSKRSHR